MSYNDFVTGGDGLRSWLLLMIFLLRGHYGKARNFKRRTMKYFYDQSMFIGEGRFRWLQFDVSSPRALFGIDPAGERGTEGPLAVKYPTGRRRYNATGHEGLSAGGNYKALGRAERRKV